MSGPKRGHGGPERHLTILDEAATLVDGPRADDYGHPSIIYAPVGRIWGAILGIPDIPPATVCLMLAGMKLGRYAVKTKRDSLVDLAGYARTVEMCESVDTSSGVSTVAITGPSVSAGRARKPDKP